MELNLKCFASLADAHECDYKGSSPHTVPRGATVRDLLSQVKMSEKDVKLIFVNGKKGDFDTVLSDGDQIGLAPATGGM